MKKEKKTRTLSTVVVVVVVVANLTMKSRLVAAVSFIYFQLDIETGSHKIMESKMRQREFAMRVIT